MKQQSNTVVVKIYGTKGEIQGFQQNIYKEFLIDGRLDITNQVNSGAVAFQAVELDELPLGSSAAFGAQDIYSIVVGIGVNVMSAAAYEIVKSVIIAYAKKRRMRVEIGDGLKCGE